MNILAVFFKILRISKKSIFRIPLQYLSKFQCVLQKGYGIENYLLRMLDFWKDGTDKNKPFGALLTDFLKVFNCPCHDLLIAKLHAYGDDIFRIIHQTVIKELK